MDFTEKSTKKDFFVHVNIISDLFKKKFLAYLKKAYRAGELKLIGEIASWEPRKNFKTLLTSCMT